MAVILVAMIGYVKAVVCSDQNMKEANGVPNDREYYCQKLLPRLEVFKKTRGKYRSKASSINFCYLHYDGVLVFIPEFFWLS